MKYASFACIVLLLGVSSSHAHSPSSKPNIERSSTAAEPVSATGSATLDPAKVQTADRILKRFAEFGKTVNTFGVTQLFKGGNASQIEFVVRKPNKISVRQPRWQDGPVVTCDGKSFVVNFRALKSCVRSEAPQTLLPLLTIAKLVRILVDKGFLEATNDERPFLYRPRRSFDDVARTFITNLVKRVFHGSRKQLLVKLLDDPGKLSVGRCSSKS